MGIFNTSAQLFDAYNSDPVSQFLTIEALLQQVEENCGTVRRFYLTLELFQDGTVAICLWDEDEASLLTKWELQDKAGILKDSKLFYSCGVGPLVMNLKCVGMNIIEFDHV